MSFIPQKPDPSSPSLPALPHYIFSEFAERYPATAAYWSSSTWPDGSTKKAARISLSVFQGRLQVQFQLLGTGLMLRLELLDPILIWDTLEAALALEVIPWERDPWVPADAPKLSKKMDKRPG